jgi:hypothetical protein
MQLAANGFGFMDGSTLDFIAPEGTPMPMKRHSAAVAVDAGKVIREFRQQMAEHKRKP